MAGAQSAAADEHAQGQNERNNESIPLHSNDELQKERDEETADRPHVAPPFPTLQVFTLAVVLFSSAFSLTMLFPFVGPMVKQLGMAGNENEYGFYAGYVSSAFMVGRMLSSFAWGSWSDRHGRKPVLAFGSFSLVFLSIAFGFSFDYTWAVLVRLASGLVNGVVGTAKTSVSELCSEEQQAKGMAVITATWGLGLAVGPAFGGILSEPVSKYPSIFSSTGIFASFPFLLPCLVCAGISLLSWITCALWLPETLSASARHSNQVKSHAKVKRLAPVYNAGNWLMFAVARTPSADRDYYGLKTVSVPSANGKRKVGYQQLNEEETAGLEDGYAREQSVDVDGCGDIELAKGKIHDERQETPIRSGIFDDIREEGELEEGDIPDDQLTVNSARATYRDVVPSVQSHRRLSSTGEGENSPRMDVEPEKVTQGSDFKLRKSKTVHLVLALYTTWSLAQIMIGDVLPLYALAKPSHGGLGLGTTLIGMVFIGMGSLLLVFQLCIYGRMAKAFGPIRLFRYGTAFQIPLSILFPMISSISSKTGVSSVFKV